MRYVIAYKCITNINCIYKKESYKNKDIKSLNNRLVHYYRKITTPWNEGPEGVKWELGLADFGLGKWGSSHTGTGIWSLGMGKNVKNQIKTGNGIWELRSGIWKKK